MDYMDNSIIGIYGIIRNYTILGCKYSIVKCSLIHWTFHVLRIV